MEVINTQIAPEAVRLIRERIRFLEEIKPFLTETYIRIVSDGPALGFQYKSTANENPEIGAFTELQKKYFERELETGISLVGPHRDDIEFISGNGLYRQYASRGQMRAASMVMRLCEAAIIEKRTRKQPVLLLDDVLFELDLKHRDLFLAELDMMKEAQIFRCVTDRIKDPGCDNSLVIEL